MVEVFKTNVTSSHQARNLVGVIEDHFDGYKVNFDLDDRDHILRIEVARTVDTDALINLMKDMGVKAEVLPDEVERFDFLTPCRRLIIR